MVRPRVGRKYLIAIPLTLGVLASAAIYRLVAAPEITETLPADTDQPTSAGPPREITADQLQSAYAENAIAADGEFKGVRLVVSGVVNDIRTDISQSAYIIFSTKNEFSGPQALLLKSQLAAAARLKAGSSIRVSCVGAGDVVKTPMLKDCTIAADADGAPDQAAPAAVREK